MFMMVKKENRLHPICSKCFYRRALAYDSYYNGKSRCDSYCAYILIEGKQRECMPTDYECASFKPRTRTKSLTGRQEMIK